MNRIRKKKPVAGASSKKEESGIVTKKPDEPIYKAMEKPSGNVAFTEQDIEFMKKAIQVLC